MSRSGIISAALLWVAVFAVAAFAQEYKVGDKVVVIREAAITAQGNKVDDALLGMVLLVREVNGKRLSVSNGKPGWLDSSNVVPLDRRAIDSFTELIRESPRIAGLYSARAVVWRALGDVDKAIEDCTEAIRLDANADAYNNRGNAWQAKGDADKAIADYTEALRLAPKHDAALFNRSVAWVNKRQPDKAIADASAALRLNPENAGALHNRGLALFFKGRFDDALADVNEALRLNPNDADAYRTRGNILVEKRQLTEALADYDKALRIDPKNATAYRARGNVWNAREEHDKAIADFTEALRLDPKDARALFNRGLVWHKKGELDKAIADYTAALRLDPKIAPFVYASRGNAWHTKKEYDKELADFQEALRIEPNLPARYDALAWLRATCVDAKYRDGKQAVEYATKACELTAWRNALHLETLAAAYAESGDFAKAVEWQKKAVAAAAQDKKQELASRLALYEAGKPYRE